MPKSPTVDPNFFKNKTSFVSAFVDKPQQEEAPPEPEPEPEVVPRPAAPKARGKKAKRRGLAPVYDADGHEKRFSRSYQINNTTARMVKELALLLPNDPFEGEIIEMAVAAFYARHKKKAQG